LNFLASENSEVFARYIEKSFITMAKQIASFEEFCKMGTHPFVKQHYSGASDKAENLADPKDAIVKGKGDAEHTEEVKADDLSDPKNANEGK
jgi:hypothetical protein